jgi:hypothetical protein
MSTSNIWGFVVGGWMVSVAAPALAGSLKVSSFPDGASVSVDGAATGKTTPAQVAVPNGPHTILVERGAGWRPVTTTVVVVDGNNDLSVTLLPEVTAGQSVIGMSLAPGADAACPYGGSKLSSANGDTYACNGAPGLTGDPGAAGDSVIGFSLGSGDPHCPWAGAASRR